MVMSDTQGSLHLLSRTAVPSWFHLDVPHNLLNASLCLKVHQSTLTKFRNPVKLTGLKAAEENRRAAQDTWNVRFSYFHNATYHEVESSNWKFLGGKTSCHQRAKHLKSYLPNEIKET